MFDINITIIIRDDLAIWQKLNVTAFLMSSITGANPRIVGKTYQYRDGKRHLAMSVQPVIVLAGTANVLTNIRNRAKDTGAIRLPTSRKCSAPGMMTPTAPYLPSMTLPKPTQWELP